MEPEVAKVLLRFIYFREDPAEEAYQNGMAIKMFIIADIWCLEKLTKIIEQRCFKDISPSNAVDILNLAESHNRKYLWYQAVRKLQKFSVLAEQWDKLNKNIKVLRKMAPHVISRIDRINGKPSLQTALDANAGSEVDQCPLCLRSGEDATVTSDPPIIDEDGDGEGN